MSGLIDDASAVEEFRRAWKTVRIVQASVRSNINAGMFGGGIPLSMDFANLSHSLVLLFAFSVLEDVLLRARDDGRFSCKTSRLGVLMDKSRPKVRWVAFDTVDEGRDVRNQLAHDQTIPVRGDSWRFIDAIEAELVAWGVMEGPVKAEYTITVTPHS